VLQCSETRRLESVDTAAISPTKDLSGQSALTSASGLDQGKTTSKGRHHVDVAVKRKQIGQKRKSLQEMRHLLNTARITVLASVSPNT